MKRILGVPHTFQSTAYSCGPATLKMALGYFGVHENERKLIHEARANSTYGTHAKWMMHAVRTRGFYAYVNNHGTLEEAGRLLQNKIPVIVRYIEPQTRENHYALISGITRDRVLLRDPWFGPNFSLTRYQFVHRWFDRTKEHNTWLMAVSQKPLWTGKQYAPLSRKKSL